MALSTDSLWPTSAASSAGRLLYLAELAAATVGYVIVAKLCLSFASINASATPIWPPAGLALALLLWRGRGLWPAIFLGAFITNLTTAGTGFTSLLIAGGNTLEAVMGAWLVNRWAGGTAVFESQAGVGKFAAIAMAVSAPVSATIGVVTLCAAGFAQWPNFLAIWTTWWLGNVAGALVVAPAILLWTTPARAATATLTERATVLFGACLIGIVAFTGFGPDFETRNATAFLVIVPLLWSALRCGQRETATAALLLSAFAVIGTAAGEGPFTGHSLNESYLLLLAFIMTATVPSLALSASMVSRDIAETRRRDESRRLLEATREQLSHAQKMEALGQITGGIAHDFNNLLHIIGSSNEMMAKHTGHQRSMHANAIRMAVRRGEDLIQQLLSFARRQKLSPTVFDIKDHLADVRDVLRASLPANVELLYDLTEKTWPVAADTTQLDLALLNIVINARDAMPAGGRIMISAANAVIADGSGLKGAFVQISVEDTGMGMTKDVAEKIFEPFFTTKEKGKGTGLGLSQVHGFAHQSGGTVTVTSKVGSGTKITLYLPPAKQ